MNEWMNGDLSHFSTHNVKGALSSRYMIIQTLTLPVGGQARYSRSCRLLKIKNDQSGPGNLLRMVRRMRSPYPPDTEFKIRALVVWGRARHLSVTEAPIVNLYEWAGKKHFASLKLECHSVARAHDLPILQAGSFTHCTGVPALHTQSVAINDMFVVFDIDNI